MGKDVYEGLADFLDELPGGFVRTEDGAEMRILRRLFTPEEAELSMKLALLSEEAPVIARRAGLSVSQTTRMLDSMADRGVIYRFLNPGKPPVYMAEQFVVGFWEGQVNHLDRELVEDFEATLSAFAASGNWGKGPQLRTIPIRQDIPNPNEILPYEQIETILNRYDRYAVANCICRQEMKLINQGCDRLEETCLAMGGGADFFVQTGRGRNISREEAFALVDTAEREGLVLQVGNDKNAGSICMCCGCCCGVLRAMKQHPNPASQGSSPFYCQSDETLCSACGECLERCPMDAISLDIGVSQIDLARCIGCGLCVSTCPSGALALVRKPDIQQRRVPKDDVEMNLKLAWARGKMGPLKMASMLLRSWFDRAMVRVAPPPD